MPRWLQSKLLLKWKAAHQYTVSKHLDCILETFFQFLEQTKPNLSASYALEKWQLLEGKFWLKLNKWGKQKQLQQLPEAT